MTPNQNNVQKKSISEMGVVQGLSALAGAVELGIGILELGNGNQTKGILLIAGAIASPFALPIIYLYIRKAGTMIWDSIGGNSHNDSNSVDTWKA